MRILRTLFWFLTASLLIGAGMWFTVQNFQGVQVKFGYWTAPMMPLAFSLLIAFGAGVLVAGIYFLVDVLRLRTRLRKSKHLAELLERELEALRNAPLYDELPTASTAQPTSFDQHLAHDGQPEASIELLDSKRRR